METSLSIGGFGLHLCGSGNLAMAMEIPGMREFEQPSALPDMEVRLDSELSRPSCRLLHQFDIADGQALCRFGINPEGVYYYSFGNEGVLRYDERNPARVDISTMHSPSLLRFALWTAYAMMGIRKGSAPVHSSIVVCNGQAVMCLGESGTGKSTHTRLWLENIHGTHLLNDDSPIVSLRNGEVKVYGSPWSGKTHCYLPESHPIAGFLRLEQKPENSIRRIEKIEAFTALQPSCPPALAKEERCMDLLVQFVSDIIQRVPVYRMGCLPDAAAAQMSHNTIIG